MNLSASTGFAMQPVGVIGQAGFVPKGSDTPIPGTTLTAQQAQAIAKHVMTQMELESKSLELKERRSRRFWGMIAGLAAGTTALVAVLSYLDKRRS
jgi:hypothetical protein